MTRRFVLVTATKIEPNQIPAGGNGIRKLKRGLSLKDFMDTYLAQFSTVGQINILRREHSFAVKLHEPSVEHPTRIFTWTFTEYPEDELLTAVAHLTREELLRDLKELLPLKAGHD